LKRLRRGVVFALSVVLGTSLLATFGSVSGSDAATASPPLDHFECYTASATATTTLPTPFPKTPSTLFVKDNFAPSGFGAATGAVQMHCNPTQQTAMSGRHSVTTPVTNAAAHLLCDTIHTKELTLPSSVLVKNEFGTGELRLIAPRSACLPSWENETTPSKFPPATAPPNLDTFVCYTVQNPQGTSDFDPPSSVKLKDQFGTVTAKIAAPNILCLSTSTLIGTDVSTTIMKPADLSVCFAIQPTTIFKARTVYEKNLFGIGAVRVEGTSELCVPSLEVVVPPPTTTTSIASTTTTSTTTTSTTTTSTTTPGSVASVENFTDPSIKGPVDIVAGPDGTSWFTNFGSDSIGQITTEGTVFNYTGRGISSPDGITVGSDGALWFTNPGNNSIGRITTDGNVFNFTDSTISSPDDIVAGPDGALWFTNFGNNSIGRITTGGAVTNYANASISRPDGITTGSDGALWFANSGDSTIGRITTAGVVSNYSDPSISTAYRLTSGPDGAIWFTNSGNNSIGRVTTAGAVTNYPDPSISSAQGITLGIDGALWFVNYGNNSIGRMTDGSITNYRDPSISMPISITVGPDGALWFTNYGNNSIGRITIAG